MIRPKNSALWCAALLLSLGLATTVGAHGGRGRGGRPHHGPFGGGPFGVGPGHNHNGMNQCRRDCVEAGRDCRDVARVTARLCVQSTCTSELQAAQDACKADRSSDACSTTRVALSQCTQPCLTAYVGSSQACRTNTRTCTGVCPGVVPKDPQCVAQCVQTSQSCVSTAGALTQMCRDTCSDLVTAASQVCSAATDPSTAAACVTAWRAALACLRPCNETLSGALRICAQAASACTNACPEVTPTPTPTPTPTS